MKKLTSGSTIMYRSDQAAMLSHCRIVGGDYKYVWYTPRIKLENMVGDVNYPIIEEKLDIR